MLPGILDKNIPPDCCARCGFLAHTDGEGGGYEPVPGPYRQGYVPSDAEWGKEPWVHRTPSPACFAGEFKLGVEIIQHQKTETPELVGGRRPSSDDIKSVIQKPRPDCPSFTPWQPGFTPKEHREMLDREFMLKREDARDEAQREFQLEQEKQAGTRHIELITAAKSGLFWDVFVVGVFATVIIGVVTIIAALIESGYWTLWWDKSTN